MIVVGNDLLQTVAVDLGIARYSTESDTQFNNRVIYSALACWIKAASQDQPVNGSLSEGVSRRHIHDKCNRVLSAYLSRYHSSKPWFSTEDTNNDAVALVRSRLLRHQELVNVGFNTNISLSVESYEHLTDDLEAIHGNIFMPGSVYNGIALTRKPLSPANSNAAEICAVSQWQEAYVQSAWWESFDVSKETNLEYFDARSITSNMYKCWQSTMPKTVDKYFMVRRPVNVTSHEYLLVDSLRHKMHRINPALQEFGEHRRFMFGLRASANNPVPGQLTKYTDHVHLKMRTYLPAKETQLLETFAWPHNSISDRLEWDMSIPVWNYIGTFLSALGMAVREEKHG